MKNAKIELGILRTRLDRLIKKELNKDWNDITPLDIENCSEELKRLVKKYTFYLDIVHNTDFN